MTEYEVIFNTKRKSVENLLEPLMVKFHRGDFSNELGNYILDHFGPFQQFLDLLVYDITNLESRPDVMENRSDIIWYKEVKKKELPSEVHLKENSIELEFYSLIGNFIYDETLSNEFKDHLRGLYDTRTKVN